MSLAFCFALTDEGCVWWGRVGRKGESVFMAKLNVMRTFRHETLLSQPMETKKVHLSKCFMRTINPLELTSSTSSAFPQAPAAEAGLRMATKPFSCGTRFVPDELGFRERFLVLVQCSQRSGYLFVPGFGYFQPNTVFRSAFPLLVYISTAKTNLKVGTYGLQHERLLRQSQSWVTIIVDQLCLYAKGAKVAHFKAF